MTRTTSGSRVRPAIVRASSPASAGVVFIFQLAAMMTGRMAPSCHRRTRCIEAAGPSCAVPFGPRAPAFGRPGPGRRRSPCRAATRSARGRAGRGRAGSPSSAASSPSGRLRRSRRRAPPRRGPCSGSAASRPSASSDGDRLELAGRGRRDPLEVRGLGVEEPVEVAPHGPARPGATRARGATSPAPIQRRKVPIVVGALPGDDAASAPDADAGRQPDRGEPGRRAPAGSSGGTTNSRWSRPWATAERAPGEEAAAQLGAPAVVGGALPGERPPRAAVRPRRAGGGPSAARGPDGRPGSPPSQAGDLGRPVAARGRGSIAASSARSAATRSRSGRAAEPAQAVRATPPRAARRPPGRGCRAGRQPAGPGRDGAGAPDRRRRRGRGAAGAARRTGGQRRRTGAPPSSSRPRRRRSGCSPGRRRRGRARSWASERLDMVGQVVAPPSRRAGWPRCAT